MTFKEFIYKNTIRNKPLYLAYFLSTLTTVMTFLTFLTFSNHPSLGESSMHPFVIVGMNLSSSIIYIFSFFYVLYSMDIFLQSRKKEFGLLLIQGMSPKQLRKMIFQENTIVGFFATVIGILAGLIFSQVLLFLSKKILMVQLAFYFPLKSIVITFVAFTILFFLSSFFIQFKIPKMDIQELIKSEDLGKEEIKSSKIKSIFALLFIGMGYAIALYAQGMQVFVAMIPVVLIVIIGTYFLFNQLSILVVTQLQKNKQRFWKKTNMLVYSDLVFRMKDNARSFFLVAIITTVVFAAIGSLAGLKEMTVASVNAMTYDFYLSDSDGNQERLVNNLEAVQSKMDNQDLNMTELRMKVVYVPESKNQNGYRVISTNGYNNIAKYTKNKKILDTNQSYRLNIDSNLLSGQPQTSYLKELPLPDGTSVSVNNFEVEKVVLPGFQNVYVVPKTVYSQFAKKYGIQQEIGWMGNPKDHDQQLKVATHLKEIEGLQSKPLIIESITETYTPVLFVGFFIGAIFFVSAGSFLYFRLYSDMVVDIQKFKIVYKLGLSRKEIKKTVYRQVGILFFTPIIVSSVHGLVALKAMYALFNQRLQMMAFMIIGLFLVIQIIYYLIASHFYFRKLYQEVTIE
ncbi:ABC transporter permease [Vagococcus sp. CY52-2]|uniref:ABC transporter permease n=1 Tax=Vagococcus sp. CY52-2 TaxID=2925838 RepID=UPI001F57ADDC|nr:ABC transporter permease [Vagococcus sp. CY52-2]UNM88712.1 ABC transporter permease [Vagococcus sp. CY52-2]